MGKWKWILGALSWVLTGPIGGLIGFILGSAIDGASNSLKSASGQAQSRQQ